MPLLYICATSPSSWSFTGSPHFPDAPFNLFISVASLQTAGQLPSDRCLLLLRHAARRITGLAPHLFVCRSGSGTAAKSGNSGLKLVAHIRGRKPACSAPRHQEITG